MIHAHRPAIAFIVLALLRCGASGAATDPALWQELDIVPMPKEIELTGRDLPLDGAVLVLGEQPSPQDQIGAQWINDRIAELGGEALPVVSAADEINAALRVIIGTRDSNALIEAAARAGEIEVGPGQPGERGYLITSRADRDPPEVLLAGADDIGALYACVTLAELLVARDGEVLLREAQVSDWPDFLRYLLNVTRAGSTASPELADVFSAARNSADPTPELRDRYLAAMQQYFDFLLRRKVSTVLYYMNLDGFKAVPPAGRALIREGVEYSKQRGIGALVYAMKPFAGLVEDYPEVGRPCLGPGRYPGWIRGWCLDDMRRQTAEDFALFCAEMGLTDIGFHDTDTGGFLSPAQWGDRCDTCKERWGDDYAAATAHKHRIFYDAIKRHIPDARVHFTIYPYNINIFTQAGAERYVAGRYGPGPGVPEAARKLREKWETFWRRLTELLPPDVTFCIRETEQENVDAYRKLIGDRGVFTWDAIYARDWFTFFSEHPRFIGTFYRGQRDFLFPVTAESFLPVKALAAVEYAWNTRAPGAAPFYWHPADEAFRHGEPEGEVFQLILPHVVRNLFGRRVADEITGALSENVSPSDIFAERPIWLKTYERMSWQMQRAREGMELLDRAWAAGQGPDDRLGMDDYAFRRFVYLREVFHSCRWMAEARAHNLHARELALEGKRDEAAAALAAGKAAVEAGRRDAEALLAERPADPIYEAEGVNRWRQAFRAHTPGVELDYDFPLRELEQTEQELPALAAAAGVPEEVLRRLDDRRLVHVGSASGPITVDGRLDEPSWAGAYPSESFFVWQAERKIAATPTAARLLYDDRYLYLGASCWLPDGGAPVAEERERDGAVMEDDVLEVFLVPPALDGAYVHLMVNAAGSLFDARGTPVRSDEGMTTYRRDVDWNAADLQLATNPREGRWDLELRISLADLGSDAVGPGWRANLGRESMSANRTREISSIQATGARDFHDLSKFRQVAFTEPGFIAPPPAAEIEVAGLEVQTRTLPDRVATVCSFGLEVRSTRVLHEAKLSAELYDAEGKLHHRGLLAERQAILYVWRAAEPFEVGFLNPVESGAIRLLLESEETTVERWVRIGGWAGTAAVGGVLADEGGIAASGALAGACAFASMVTPPGSDRQLSVFDSRQGTVEFWLRPSWSGSPGRFPGSFDVWDLRHALLHFGPLRPDYPYTVNFSSLLIDNYDGSHLRFAVYTPGYAGWATHADLEDVEGWTPDAPHHLAAVWDGDAQPEDWLRIYLDGRRASGPTQVSKPERLGEDTSVRVHVQEPYAVQLGCLTSGRAPARALLDELRISRVARYGADLAVPPTPFTADEHTSALFHFDGDLAGSGLSPDGSEYTLRAVAGAVGYH